MGWRARWGLAAALLIILLGGCSDVLVQAKRDDGGVERVRVDSDCLTDSYEDKLRIFNRSKKEQNDDLSIMLKQESTF